MNDLLDGKDQSNDDDWSPVMDWRPPVLWGVVGLFLMGLAIWLFN